MRQHSITFLLLIVLAAVTVQTVFAQQKEQHRYLHFSVEGNLVQANNDNNNNNNNNTSFSSSLSSSPECYPPSERSTCHQLSCINGTCQPCRKNSECWERTMICEKDEDGGEEGHCVVEELFERGFDVWMFLTMVIVLAVCVVGVCGGLGGGGILSPAFAGVAGFPMHDAVFLSLATIVGQAIINIPIIMMNYDPEYSPDTKNSLTVERLLERQKERKQIQQEVVREKRQRQEFVESSGPEVINHQFTINNNSNNNISASTLDTKQQNVADNEENDDNNIHNEETAAALTTKNINASTTTVDDDAAVGVGGGISTVSPKLSPQIRQKVVGYLSDLENRGGRVHFSSNTADADIDDTGAAASAHENHTNHHTSTVVDPVVLEHGPLEDVVSIPRSSFHSPRLVPTRPLAAFDILVMWFPACAAGTFVSELISKIIPNWLRMGSLFIVTCFITYRTAKRSYELRKKEEVRAKKAQRRENGGVEGGGDGSDDEKLLINRNDGDDAETATTDSGDSSIGIDDDAKTVEHLDPFSGCSSVYSMGRQQSSARKSKTPQKENSNKQGESAPLLTSAVAKNENDDQNYNSTQQQQQSAAAMKNDSITTPIIELPGNDNTQNRISLRASLVAAGAGDDDPLLHLPVDDQDDQEGPTFTPHPDSMPRIPIVEIILLILTMAIGVCVAHFVIHGDIFECGSGAYFGLIVVGVFIDLLIALIYRHRVSKIASNVSKGSTHKVRLPCNWNFKNSVVLPLLSGAAGLCSQLFGLGGGSIVAPLLLEAGVSPERVSATGSVLTGILGLQSMLVSVGGDSPPPSWSYIGMFGAIGALSTIIGRFYVLKEIKRRKASWAIVLCLSTILFFTLVASSTNGVINFVALLNYGASIGFGSMCGKGK